MKNCIILADNDEDDEYSISAHSIVQQRRRSIRCGRRSGLHRRRMSSSFAGEDSGPKRQSIATVSSAEWDFNPKLNTKYFFKEI